MSATSITRIVCLSIIGAPSIIAAATDVTVPPWAMLLLALCGMVAALVMGEMDPLRGRPGLADQLRALSPASRARLVAELERPSNG